MHASDVARDHPDALADAPPPFVTDRQRIVHSAAFRRLKDKTQVFVAPESDHFRTRLTHTLEVAHLARCIAVLLGLDSDLAEVVALAHDLGHPPFGHAGEQALNDCMRDHGGFEHNQHTLRVIEELEHPYPEFRGLNLTRIVRECLAKHTTQYDRPGPHPLQDGRPPPAEGLVVDLADRFAYALHDVQDALYAGLLTPLDLQGTALWDACYTGPVEASPDAWRPHLRPAIDRMQQRLLAGLPDALPLSESRPAGRDQGEPASNRRGVAGCPSRRAALTLPPQGEAELTGLGELLRSRVYRSELLVRADGRARRLVKDLFHAYLAHPAGLPERFRKRLDAAGPHRVIADYIAGMTDRFCLQEHARLAGPVACTENRAVTL